MMEKKLTNMSKNEIGKIPDMAEAPIKLATFEEIWEDVINTPSQKLEQYQKHINDLCICVYEVFHTKIYSAYNITYVEVPSGDPIKDEDLGKYKLCLNPDAVYAIGSARMDDDCFVISEHFDISPDALALIFHNNPLLQQIVSDKSSYDKLTDICLYDLEYAPTVILPALYRCTPFNIFKILNQDLYMQALAYDKENVGRIQSITSWPYYHLIDRIYKSSENHHILLDSSMEYEIEEDAEQIAILYNEVGNAIKAICRKDYISLNQFFMRILDMRLGENYLNGQPPRLNMC